MAAILVLGQMDDLAETFVADRGEAHGAVVRYCQVGWPDCSHN